ncbi:hypothetical protein [Cupriavidus sp. UYPR2.512]|uniref:hypothetical protein n=1 Tax=Cupriavidus sp. UYPR2.512 TaxID=1080187 RepID=UPI00036E8EC4|nr:hypothetical protein [Cupriavidus sp. UYPR2.512]UIF85145.1 hypothetical protein KAF44_13350 [Cupriavidus necator]
MDITYFENEYLPGVQHFQCELLRASLSVESCSGNWRRANHEQDLARHRCRGCSVGAQHAGDSGASTSPFRGTLICGRCHRGASRLIHAHLCVSCYNREREWLIGKNGKGSPPIKLARLDPRGVTYQRADGTVHTRAIDRTVDTEEVLVAVLRDEQQATTFGFAGRMRVSAEAAPASVPEGC